MGTELAEPGGRERSRRRALETDSESVGENDVEGPDNLDFLFYRRLYSFAGRSAYGRAAHRGSSQKGWAMKEFDKKSSPSREGFSEFLPASMSDSSTRRRLTEYEIQLQDLQAYVRSLEAETVHLRKKLEDTPKDFMRSEEHTSELQSQPNLVCRLL